MTYTGKTNVVIVGAGIFGMSTALWMLETGKYSITILDKSDVLPAPDAASTDINKIIRAGDYKDPLISRLAVDAVSHWRKPEWEGTYHECGVVALSAAHEKEGMDFVNSAYKNCRDLGLDATLLPDATAIKPVVDRDNSFATGSFGGRQGYINPIGGWGESGRAVEVGLKRAKKLGAVVRAGAEVTGLIKEGKDIKGVELKSGEKVFGDLVVIAAGAWTPKLFASPSVAARLPPIVATGQSVAILQLTPEEAKKYAKVPVVFNLDDGWYIFPPNPTGLMKMAIHSAGYVNPVEEVNGVSVPRTKLTPGAEDGAIPKVMLQALRKGLSEVYPELAKKDYVMTRLCWYCDTVTGDWLIDYHPDYNNLFLATGGSGHAFKFASNIGREIVKLIERDPSSEFKVRFAFSPPKEMVEPASEKGDVSAERTQVTDTGADVRCGMRKHLLIDDLIKPEDLKAY
ncbi:sarcosine oxidase [Cryptococcus deuterogattii R265]|uniref:Sarcosine oxidase n=1 Tax=Cryptococcus deuterogattii (strain R265) TaxID=294750 RepID=A0A095CER0_CRYD2|nr:sarcosine oxidase [Cryptococcus deuterogattii R265]KIR26989.1 sarcosine oxidase [Cryptococcus deuterogattii LA55]KIR36520.1 sarcosine oxidase [Cryptococcus deuterogattii MMRL2647]KIR75950.1 sarcosine oxidase [Cryptococcus deuterogattii CA1014]KIR95893.1 sarcosine oxidase [Cryptococcus deuterogattii CBS 10090]KIS02389.1 sarcosine oxidase [Cryptococcus deuterogattii 2001/935-1]